MHTISAQYQTQKRHKKQRDETQGGATHEDPLGHACWGGTLIAGNV